MSGSSRSPFSPLGTSLANWVAELIPVFLAMLLMSYLEYNKEANAEKEHSGDSGKGAHTAFSEASCMIYVDELTEASPAEPSSAACWLRPGTCQHHGTPEIFPLDSSPFALFARKGERTMLRLALPAVFWAILVSTKVRSAFSTFGFLISTWIKFQWHVLIYDSYLMRH